MSGDNSSPEKTEEVVETQEGVEESAASTTQEESPKTEDSGQDVQTEESSKTDEEPQGSQEQQISTEDHAKLQKSYDELLPKFTKASQKNSELQKFKDENAPIIDALNRNPEILQTLLESEQKRSLTQDEVNDLVDKRVSSRESEQAEIQLIQDFAKAREEFKDPEFKQQFMERFGETGASISATSLEMVYDHMTKEAQLEKTKETAREEAVAEVKRKNEEKALAAGAGTGDASNQEPMKQALFGGSPNINNLL